MGSYVRATARWNDAVFAVVRRIPRGRVATYGQIALLLGRPRGGREVGWALHACDDPRVPCHRVVDRNGRLAPHFGGVGPIAQRDRLEREGVRFRGDLVDVVRYAWSPRAVTRVTAVGRDPASGPRRGGASRRSR